MYRVFNMGVGMVWFVPADRADEGLSIIRGAGFHGMAIGEVTSGDRKVEITL